MEEARGRGAVHPGSVRPSSPLACRVPRGRCVIPKAPVPSNDRTMGDGQRDRPSPKKSTHSGKKKLVIVPKKQLERKQLPPWQAGYVGFMRKLGSRLFLPLLMLFSLGALGTHLLALSGGYEGHFEWKLNCEGLVQVSTTQTAVGIQTYSIGWAGYEAVNSRLEHTATGASNTVTVSLQGIAGSRVDSRAPLSAIDPASAALGGISAALHMIGTLLHIALWASVIKLFRDGFRSTGSVFRLAGRLSGVIGVLVIACGVVGFYLTVVTGFTSSVQRELGKDNFRCDQRQSVTTRFAFLGAVFASIANALVALLGCKWGAGADLGKHQHHQTPSHTAQPQAPQNKTMYHVARASRPPNLVR
ncbi:unnamed protein product [Chrysoparadoxa australica]